MSNRFFWRTITIGTYKDLESMRKAFADSGMEITTHGNVIFRQLSLSEVKKSIDIALVSQVDLGFRAGARITNEEILKAAKKQGLGLCPAEIGPQLRLQYPDQPEKEYMVIGMDPLMEFDPMFFTVFNSGNLCLGSDFANPAYWYNDLTRFAFVCNK